MVIDAGRIFECTHTYVAIKEGKMLLFACPSCGYRRELLPLHLRPSSPQVVAFRRTRGRGTGTWFSGTHI